MPRKSKKDKFVENDYFNQLDKKANYISKKLSESKNISCKRHATKVILCTINDIYNSQIFKEDNFEYSLHSPVPEILEFFIARILYFYSKEKGKEWKIYSNIKYNGVKPDIRIESNDKTLAIIEIKTTVGSCQCLFSKKIYNRETESKLKTHPDIVIDNLIKQLHKYEETFKTKNIFVLVPTLKAAYRERDSEKVEDYRKWFNKKTDYPKNNLILLSNNLKLDLSKDLINQSLSPSEDFEKFIKKLNR